jgi:hypothetical protein
MAFLYVSMCNCSEDLMAECIEMKFPFSFVKCVNPWNPRPAKFIMFIFISHMCCFDKWIYRICARVFV